MPIIDSAMLDRLNSPLDNDDRLQIYCGLDGCVTLEILETLRETYKEQPKIYSFERAIQGPYLEIMQRGFCVDSVMREREAAALRQRRDMVQQSLDQLAFVIWDKALNPRSPAQLKQFFYQHLKLPEVWISQKGERKLSTNREALEKLEVYLHARPIVACILLIRDLSKQLEVLTTDIDFDVRYRTSYNIAGTETGRPSSSENAFGTGGNAQNIAPSLRHVFISDPGMKLGYIDLEQVEARDVGFFCGCLFDDWTFLDAAESGDLHTSNAKLVWPELAWTGDLYRDKKIAEQIFYRDFSFRDMAKRGGHLSNYYGGAWQMARSLKIPLEVAEEFQARYVRGRPREIVRGVLREAISPAFPCISRWWQWTAEQMQTTHQLITPFGRKRLFFGRPGDDTTLREAIAFLPQSTTADRMNLGLYRVWKKMPQVQLLAQTYDSITFQYSESANESTIMEQALELIRVELRAPNGRLYVVPGEAKCGWNWGPWSEKKNPLGLRKWKKNEKDDRKREPNLLRRMIAA